MATEGSKETNTSPSLGNLLSWLVFLLVVAYLIYQQAPLYYDNFRQRGQPFPQVSVLHLKDGQVRSFPPDAGPILAVFWASNCGPCLLEMGRLKSAVENDKIPGERIFAINPYETRAEIFQFLQESPYPFQFIDDRGVLAGELNVRVTPTFVWLEANRILKITTGVHLIGHFELERFLKNEPGH